VTGAGDEIGWGGALLRVAVLFGKTFLVILAFMVIRWTWPRFRFDQLMALGWKVMLPLGVVNLALVATIVEFFPHWPAQHGWLFCAGMWLVALCVWLATAMLAPAPSQRNAPIAVPKVE
jgi:NADH-quinone oxidoreductase subunit H